jgi:outer membrane protein assembly factor BamD (BamD/ComL family)
MKCTLPGGEKGIDMRKIFLILAMALMLVACGDQAKDLYETAQLEERQYNRENAVKLYREVMEKHPKSPYAQQAAERMAELEKEETK